MNITAYSVATAWIWTSLLIVIMCTIQQNRKTLHYFGVRNLLILYGFCILRTIVPIELPITRVIPVKGVYNIVTRFCVKPLIGAWIPAGYVLLVIWGSVTAVKLCILVKDYWISNHMFCYFPIQYDESGQQVLEKLQREHGDHRKITVYRTSLTVPMETGIWHSRILLPDQRYTQQQLYYIIRHEYFHILHHDTATKLIINLWMCIFWWNPVTYVLSRNMENTLELNCDLTVVNSLDHVKRAEYLSTILYVMKNRKKPLDNKCLPKSMNALYKLHNDAELVKRFRMISECVNMTETAQKRHKLQLRILSAVYMIAFFLSYCFVIQSKFEVPAGDMTKEVDDYYIEPEKIYLCQNGNVYEVVTENGEVIIIDEETAMSMKELGLERK